MKLTVITKSQGEIVGYAPSAEPSGTPGQFRAGLLAGPGQQLHEVEVDDGLTRNPDREKLHGQLRALLQKKK